MKKTLFILLITPFLFTSCAKNEIPELKEEKVELDNQLKKSSTNSANTFGAVSPTIFSIIAEKLGEDVWDASPYSYLSADLGADELDLIEICMAVESEFMIEIADDEREKLLTIQDYIDIVQLKLDNNEEDCSEAENSAEAITTSEDVRQTLLSTAPTTRTKMYEWKFLRNTFGMWDYTSKEKGTHVKIGSEWHWDKLEHLTHGRNGIVAVASISVSDVTFTPQVGTYVAGCTLNFNFSSSLVCKGVPLEVNFTQTVNSPVWNSNTP